MSKILTQPWTDDRLRVLGLIAFWNVVFFALLRAPWIVSHAEYPLTALQAALAAWYGGRSDTPVVVTLECSAADVMDLCAAIVLAYPASWRRRLAGLGLILPVLFVVNVIRIGTLARVAGSPRLFNVLHVYVWPGVLVAVAVCAVLWWMRAAGGSSSGIGRPAKLAFYTIGGFAIAAPWLSDSIVVAASCRLIAAAAAAVIRGVGLHASAAGAFLTTSRGSFAVTPECVVSPVIPLWVLGVFAAPLSRRDRALGLAFTIPVVGLLATARLLALAAPASMIASPLVLVHGFHALVLFAAIVAIAAWHGRVEGGARETWAVRAAIALAVTAAAALMLGASYDALVLRATARIVPIAPHALLTLRPAHDVQGAIAILPVYQIGLFAAMLWAFGRRVRARDIAMALGTLAASQVAVLVAAGELAAHAHVHTHALVVRAWSVAWPVALGILVLRRAAAATAAAPDVAYRAFWDHVGRDFPDLGGAASTDLYRRNEQRLIADHLGNLEGRRILKTDLWDEARNTRILQWIERQGAHVAGIDISGPVVESARREFGGRKLLAAGADVRALPFRDGAFDALYSMGTVEHFDETEQALRECFRVLRPGGRAVIGVPNRRDPFLRPLLVAILYRLGLYDYGFEKSYSHRALRHLLEAAGFSVVAEDGILFIPGWLRMLDLLCHTRCRPLSPITGAAVSFFGWIEARFPAVRRHGYLIAASCERPRSAQRFSATGKEWIVDASGCDAAKLRSRETLGKLFDEIVRTSGLTPIAPCAWHAFAGEAGVTGLQMLSESHLACHTYPETRYAAFSLYSCRADHAPIAWEETLARTLDAAHVVARVVHRGPQPH
jgi:S-adenosylmethionine decarboxylase